MVPVGARLNCGIDDSAVVVAEFRGSILSNDIELSDGIGRGCEAKQIIRYLIVIDAVQQEVVGLLAVPVDIGTSRFLGGVGSEIHAMGIDRDGASRKQGQLHIVPGFQWQIVGGSGIDDVIHLGIFRLQDRRRTAHFQSLRDLADPHLEVETCRLVERQRKGRMNCSVKSRRGRFHPVGPNRKVL